MYFKATLKSPMRAFMLVFIYLVWLVGLPLGETSAKDLPLTNATNSAIWLNNYLSHHPHSPLLSSAWRTEGRYFADGPLWSYAGSQSSVTFGVACALCRVDDGANAIDANRNTAATLVLPVGAVGGVGLKLQFSGTYQAGDQVALDLEIPDQFYSNQLLSAVSVNTFRGGVSNNDAISLNSELVRISVLGAGLGSTPKFRVIVPVTHDFDEVQVSLSALIAGFGSLRVYEATAFIPVTVNPAAPIVNSGGIVTFSPSIRIPGATFNWYTAPEGGTSIFNSAGFTTPPLNRTTTYYVTATNPADGLVSSVRSPVTVRVSGGAGPIWTFADQEESPLTAGIACALCYVNNPDKAVDGDTTTASTLSLPVGALTSVGQLLRFPGDYKAGDRIVMDLEIPGQLVSAAALAAIQIQTFNNDIANNDITNLGAGIIRVDALGLGISGKTKFRVTVPVAKDFDAAQISLSTAFAAFGVLNVYEAAAIIPVTVTPAAPTITAGTNVTLTAATGARISAPVYRWYTTPTGGTPVAIGSDFPTPLLSRTTTYYAEAYSPAANLSSYVRTPVTVKVAGGPGTIWSYGQEQQSPITGGIACAACSVTTPGLAVDGDTTTSAILTVPLGVAGTVGQLVKLPGVYQAGDSIILFLEAPAEDLAGVVLPGVKVTTFNNSIAGPAVSNNDGLTLDASVVKLQLLGIGLNNARKFRVAVPATKTFDGVQVDFGGLVGVSGSLKLYEVAAMIPVTVLPQPAKTAYNTPITLTPTIRLSNPVFHWYTAPQGGAPVFTGSGPFTTPSLIRNTTYYVEAEDPAGTTSLVRTAVPVTIGGGTGPLWTFGTGQQAPVTSGVACALCNVQNPAFASDGDTTTASHLSLPLGVAATLGQKISFPGTYHSGDSIILILGAEADILADAALLGSIGVSTSLNNVNNNDKQLLNGALLDIDLLQGINGIKRFRVAIPVSHTFDGAQIDIGSLLGANNSLYIYEAIAMTPVTVAPSPAAVNTGQTATLNATLPGIPGAIFNWYETPEGSSPIYTGSSFKTPPLFQHKTYYVEAISPADGLISIRRTAVDVNVNNASGNGQLSCSGSQTQSNGTGGVCLLCTVDNPGLAVDNDPATASKIRLTLGALGNVYQDLVFPVAGKAGDTVRLGLGTSTGLLDLAVLGGISVGLGNGTRPANAEMGALQSDLLTVRLLNGVQQSAYTFVANKNFDRVEIRLSALVGAITELNLYYAQVVTPVAQVAAGNVFTCSGSPVVLSATGPAGYTLRWYTSYTGGAPVGYGASFTTPAITKDTTYFVEAAGADSCGSERRMPVQVKTGLPGVVVTPSSAAVAEGTTPTFNVVAPDPEYIYNWYNVPAGGTPVFVGTQFTTPPVTANATYYAEAVLKGNASCKSLRTPVAVTLNGDGGPATPGDIDCGGATGQQTAASGICIGCFVEKQDSAVDNSTQTASVMHTVLGVGASIQQSLIFPAAGVKGDSVRIKLGFVTALADLGLLSGIQISSSNNATVNNDGVTLSPGLLNLRLLNGNRDLIYTFAPGAAFDRVNVKLSGLATALTTLKVYSAQIFAGTPTVEKDTVYICQGGTATLRATGPGTSFRWYNQPVGGTVLASGATYQVSDVTNAIYYVEALSSSGCVNPARKAVYVIVGLPQPLVTPSVSTIDAGQTVTFTVNGPNPAYQYNWYNAPAGGTLLKANSTSYTTPALSAAAVYYVEVRDPVNNCTSPTRTAVRVDINMPDEPTPCSYATQQVSPVIAGICLLCSVADPALAVDQNANSASTITSTLSAVGYVGQLLRFNNTYPAGDSVTLDLEIPGQLADAALLGGVRLETYNGNTPNGDAIFLNNSIVHLTLLNTGNKFRVTLPVAKAFNGVLVSINGVIAALTRVKVYFAAVVTSRPQVATPTVNVCSGSVATLVATSPNGADLAWYTAAVGGTPLPGNGTYVTPALTASATYYVEASRFGCANPVRIPVRVNVGTTPAAPTAAGRSICAGNPAALLATAPAGATFRWYSAATGGTLLASTANYTTNVLNADTAFYVEADNNGCKSATRTRVPVTVSAGPANLTVTPPATSVISGQGAIFTANATGTNVIYKWYNMSGDSIYTGAVFNTGPLTATSTFSVEAVNAGGCKSGPRVSVTATVVPGSNDIPCDAATSQENAANGICVGCYVENPGLAVDNSTLSKSTLHVVLGLLNGYVQQSLIFPQISEPGDSAVVSLSFDNTLADVGLLSAIEIGSYNGAVSNNDFIALNNPIIKLTLLGGNKQALAGFKPKALFDRLVIRLRSGAASALSAVNVHFASRVVGLPVVKGDTVCTGHHATLTASGPANVSFRWYTTATGGAAVSTGTSYQTPALTANTTYYVEAVKASLNCPNPQRVAVTAIVDPVPAIPVLDTTALSICSGSTATFNVKPVAGVIYRWYTAPAGGTLLFTGTSYRTPNLTATTAYYIEASNTTGCINTNRKMVTATIVGRPGAPAVSSGNVTICANSSAQLAATSATPGAVFRWYTTAAGGTPVFEGASFQTPVLTASATYYVEAAAGACTSAARTTVAVTVNPVPATPTVTTVPVNGEVVSGQSAILTASSATPGAVYNWYTVATGGSPVFTGPIFTTPALTSGITYYVEAVAGACPGARTAVPLTVTVVPNTTCDFANAQSNSTTAICALCSVVDAQNTTDADVNNYSILSVPLAAGGGSVQQSLIFPGVAAAGDSVRIVMELPAQLVDASLLSSLEVSSFNGATANNDALLLNSANVSIRLVSGSDKFTVAFAPGAAYDRVQVRLRGGVVAALVKLHIYYATRQVSAPVVAARNITICSGNTATLTATASPVAKLEWYDAPVGGQKVFEGASFITPALTATKTYYVQSVRTSNDCANPNRVSVTVSVVPGLVAPTVNSAAICAGQQATLTANVTGSNIQTRWYSAPTGGTLLFTGTTYVTNALSTDTAFYVETGNGACTLSSRVKATVTVGGSAPAPVLEAQNVNICAGSVATFKVTSATAGITYKWYTALTGGTPVDTGATFTTPLLSATTVYYVEASSNSSACSQASARVAATATVAARPAVPVLVSDDVEICAGQNAVLFIQNPQNNVSYQFYTAPTGGTLVSTGPVFVVTGITGNVTFYVQAVNNNGCVNAGDRVPVAIRVLPAPATPVVTAPAVAVCPGSTVTLSVQNPNASFAYRWYTTATGGTPVDSGSSFTTPAINSATNYYVEAGNGNCSSPARARVAVSVSTAPPVPVLESDNVSTCTGGTATLRVISNTNGVTYNWYTAATGGTKVFSGPAFVTPALNNSTVYYVEAVSTNSQCTGTSSRVAVTVTVGVSPDVPVLTAASVRVCAGQDVTLSVQHPQAGVSYQWFDAVTGGTLVFTGSNFMVTAVNANVSYYVQAASGSTCVSASRAAASITVDAAAPTPDVVAANMITCVGGTATFNVLNPDAALTYRWYNAPANGILLASGPEYTTAALNKNTTFYVEALNGSGCSSQARKGVTATVVNTIDAPLADGATICAGNAAVLNVKDPLPGISYKWYTAATGGTPVFTGAAFTTAQLNVNTTYYVEAATGGCISQSRTIVPVTVNTTPTSPVVTDATVTVCPGEIATLSVQQANAALTYRWYDSPTGGTPVATGNSIMTPAITANITYYVEALNTSGCASIDRTPVNIILGASASNAAVGGNADLCPGGMATLTATSATANAGFRWYTAATGGAPIATGATFITPALNQNTTYYVEAVSPGGCSSTSRTAVQVNILAPLASPVVTVSQTTPTQVTFEWTAVPGATAYQVTLDNGVTYVVPSSGPEGLSHIISGLSPAQTVTIRVRAVGIADCETSALSTAVTGTTENPQGNNIFVPNVFTPNGDGFNDVHYVYGNTIVNIVMRYYNQFGQQIFETKDQRNGWDGTMGGRQQPVGVYIYVLRATLQDGSVVNKKGTVTIVR
ncbi:gliding motility-associated C-terminal domain-containing protein [Chitinophaga filiformis]|uniref:Gliding motility-associated C-terminal domain-containing protein n=1 Tax=Chitinophaga filiformis TaxID=104663 RepID=A0ABY4I325_CHIFI|nr:gliding motility-associated C-terminal domain-containing protein [Chitinophaga filiformis]UPK70227.1 gliding motility-associated C-terminal domain-containing protein [Chitinophaga filiformis]